MRQSDRAFSLIEIIVAVGVAAILLGVLLPALGAVRSTAELTGESLRLRTTAQVIDAYAADHDDTFPYTGPLPSYWEGGGDQSKPVSDPWYYAVSWAGFMTPDEALSPDGHNVRNINYSKTLQHPPETFTPGAVPAWENRVNAPLRASSVRYPSSKGSMSYIRVGSSGDDDAPETWRIWCCFDNPPGPVAFLDGSIDVVSHTSFPMPDPVPTGLIGMPVSGTWYGIKGRDR